MAKQKFTKRKDGRYSAYVFMGYKADGSEKRAYVYSTSERELEKKLFTLRMSVAQGTYIENENMTVSEWGEIWLDTYKKGKEHNTYQMYENAIKTHISDELGHIKLKDLKQHHVQKLINVRAARGLTRTLEIIKLTLVQMLDMAIENEHLVKNVAKRIALPSISRTEKRPLTDLEIEYAENSDFTLKEKAFFNICLYAGLRRGEALALTKNDIKDGYIHVTKTIIFKKNNPEIKSHPKSEAGNRAIPVIDKIKPILDEYVKSVKGIYLFEAIKKSGPMSLSSFRRMWESIQRKMNIAAGGSGNIKGKKDLSVVACADITPHMLRHTYATNLYYAGVDVRQAQNLMGHSDPTITLKFYTHLRKKESAPLEKLNLYFSPQKKAPTRYRIKRFPATVSIRCHSKTPISVVAK